DTVGGGAEVDLRAGELAGGVHVDHDGEAAGVVDEVGGGVGVGADEVDAVAGVGGADADLELLHGLLLGREAQAGDGGGGELERVAREGLGGRVEPRRGAGRGGRRGGVGGRRDERRQRRGGR